MMSQTEKKDLKGTGVADPFRASKIDIDVSKMIAENISCLVDKKTSVILISVTDQDPMVAAIIADTIQSRLQYYITDYRTKKARNDMKYYTKLYNEARSAYLKAQKSMPLSVTPTRMSCLRASRQSAMNWKTTCSQHLP